MKESAKEKRSPVSILGIDDLGGKHIISVSIAVAMVILAVSLFLCTGMERFDAAEKTLLWIIGVLLIALVAQFLVYVFVLGEQKQNYFLTDAETGRTISPRELDFETVDARLDAYLGFFVRNKAQLWLPGGIAQCDFGENDCFRPAVAYKMLTDLAKTDSDGAWKCFCGASPAVVKWISDALGEYEARMSKDLLAVKMRFSGDPARVRGFVKGNENYLRNRLLAYVTENLSLFDGVEI